MVVCTYYKKLMIQVHSLGKSLVPLEKNRQTVAIQCTSYDFAFINKRFLSSKDTIYITL